MKDLPSFFSYQEFLEASQEQRKNLCDQLASWIGEEIQRSMPHGASDPKRREVIAGIIKALAEIGHDLVCYDESEDWEVWIHEYDEPHKVGLLLELGFEDDNDVCWHDVPPRNEKG